MPQTLNPNAAINWHFARPALARYYFDLLFGSGVRRLALFGRRRIGKTEFLLQDLIPYAQQQATSTVYCSLWENKDRPQISITQALEQASTTKAGAVQKLRLQLGLPDIAQAEIEVERAQHPRSASTQELAQLTTAWRAWLAQLKSKPALLVFDEIQHLASSARFATLAATLRTLLDIAPPNVRVVFTGSSHADLQRLFTNNKAAFYQFADVLPFEPMSHDFVQHLEQIFKRITSMELASGDLGKLFEFTGRNAHLITGLTQRLVIYKTTNVKGMWQDIAENLTGSEGWCEQQWSSLNASDKIVYKQLLAEQEPFSESALRVYAQEGFSRATAQKALLRLENKGLISRLGHGQYLREIPLLDQWVAHQVFSEQITALDIKP
jgi:uncharacterized protein